MFAFAQTAQSVCAKYVSRSVVVFSPFARNPPGARSVRHHAV